MSKPFTKEQMSGLLGALFGGFVSAGATADVVREIVRAWAAADSLWVSLSHLELFEERLNVEMRKGEGGGTS